VLTYSAHSRTAGEKRSPATLGRRLSSSQIPLVRATQRDDTGGIPLSCSSYTGSLISSLWIIHCSAKPQPRVGPLTVRFLRRVFCGEVFLSPAPPIREVEVQASRASLASVGVAERRHLRALKVVGIGIPRGGSCGSRDGEQGHRRHADPRGTPPTPHPLCRRNKPSPFVHLGSSSIDDPPQFISVKTQFLFFRFYYYFGWTPEIHPTMFMQRLCKCRS
jgi:hypothetical protein